MNGRRDAIGAMIVAVIILATDLAAPSGMEEAAVEDPVPSPSLHRARLGGTMRAGDEAVVAAAVDAISSEAMEVEGAEDAATVKLYVATIKDVHS